MVSTSGSSGNFYLPVSDLLIGHFVSCRYNQSFRRSEVSVKNRNGRKFMQAKVILGVDAGGTFTDFVLMRVGEAISIRTLKILSSPDAPQKAILEGIAELGLVSELMSGDIEIVHGSTVATNAVLENKLAKTAFITNHGFKDLLTLGRQTRPALYQLEFEPIPAPVPRNLCFETGGRLGADGSIVEGLSQCEVEDLLTRIILQDPESVAINLLFSFVNPDFEILLEKAFAKRLPTVPVSRSSAVLPVYKEFERGITTWLNAALEPIIYRYLVGLKNSLGKSKLQIMQSSGETISGEAAADKAVNLLLSGPAGGLKAVQYLGREIGVKKLVSFDMGGTSTDVALIDGKIETTTEGTLGPYPVGVPMLDMHTIGAGGGSIAFIDEGGLLRVGPKSAGASPGPACYAKGGLEPTVTDAHLVLGRLSDKSGLAGVLKLEKKLAIAALEKLSVPLDLSVETVARGIIRIANEHMIEAIRLISVNRGHDPKDFSLVSFGGAGGLHVCEIAEGMRMEKAIVPVCGGVLSALGMLVAERGRQFVHTVNLILDTSSESDINQHFARLVEEGRRVLVSEGIEEESLRADYSADCRYQGQSSTLNIAWEGLPDCSALFANLHHLRYGYSLKEKVEIVNLRATVYAPAREFRLSNCLADNGSNNFSEIDRDLSDISKELLYKDKLKEEDKINGPAVISQYASTTYVAPGWKANFDAKGNLLLTLKKVN